MKPILWVAATGTLLISANALAAQASSTPRGSKPAAPSGSNGEVSLYGLANAGIDNYSAGTSAVGDKFSLRQRVFSSGSRIGVRGGLDLGHSGLRAVFQIESGLNLDNGSNTGQSGSANPSAGPLSSRASWVGVEGNFGRVLVGRQDVYWFNGAVEQTAENYISTGVPWMSGGNSGKGPVGVALQSNVLSYMTPKLGKNGRVTMYFSPDAGGGAFGNSEQAQGNFKANGRLLAANGSWSGGSLVANADIAYKKGASDLALAGPAGFQDVPSVRAIKLGLGWKYAAGAQLSAIVSQSTSANTSSDARLDYNAKYVSVNWEQTRGQWQLLGQAGKAFGLSGCAGAVSGNCDNTGAIGFLVAARYLFAKDVSAYGFVTQVSNQAGIFHDYTDYRYSSIVPSSRNVGADPRIFGVGMRFSFDAMLAKR
jgi:Gram-negative porin